MAKSTATPAPKPCTIASKANKAAGVFNATRWCLPTVVRLLLVFTMGSGYPTGFRPAPGQVGVWVMIPVPSRFKMSSNRPRNGWDMVNFAKGHGIEYISGSGSGIAWVRVRVQIATIIHVYSSNIQKYGI
ncbi:hypothetical protein BKA70DRAFT_1221642 [Coprinopsis sp. MPI-PUGE-AT-0042]|nr:hypothetical protein BKA70DRAFT_1221642 [Coprinopsis sp. MPI-PUGE-AT-0042]